MKSVNEYTIDDLPMIKEQAWKVAMATIHNIYEETHDEEHVCYEDICSVKKAIETIQICLNLK